MDFKEYIKPAIDVHEMQLETRICAGWDSIIIDDEEEIDKKNLA